jgi:hypothetical protein
MCAGSVQSTVAQRPSCANREQQGSPRSRTNRECATSAFPFRSSTTAAVDHWRSIFQFRLGEVNKLRFDLLSRATRRGGQTTRQCVCARMNVRKTSRVVETRVRYLKRSCKLRTFGGSVAVISTVCYHFSQLSITERERSDRFQCESCALFVEIGRCAPVL